MGNMKRLHEAIEEAERLTRSQPLDEEGLNSMLETVAEIARYHNGVETLLDTLFHPRS